MTVENAIQKLFDKHGRRISKGLSASVCDANRKFRLDQPKLDEEVDFANRILWLHGCLGVDTGITAEQFQKETERLLDLIRGNSQIVNIPSGVYLPIVLPKLVTDDLGTTFEQYLGGADNSYAKTFGDRKFHNYCKGGLEGNVSVIDGSRHDQLIERMKQGPVIGLYFPNPLQGFSVQAQRGQMATLPPACVGREGFILSGLDTVIAMIMYPDVMARDRNTPGMDLAAFSWQSPDQLFNFEDNDHELGFRDDGLHCRASGSYSGGLLFLPPESGHSE